MVSLIRPMSQNTQFFLGLPLAVTFSISINILIFSKNSQIMQQITWQQIHKNINISVSADTLQQRAALQKKVFGTSISKKAWRSLFFNVSYFKLTISDCSVASILYQGGDKFQIVYLYFVEVHYLKFLRRTCACDCIMPVQQYSQQSNCSVKKIESFQFS